jgi:uncharacterized protein (TIGR02001 family)
MLAAIVGASFAAGTTAAVAADLGAGPAPLAEPVASDRPQISTNATFASDYRFRGFTQTRESAALQGGFDVLWRSFYVGVWATNVDFGRFQDLNSGTWKDVASVEVVTYAGMKRKFANTELDFRAIYYAYPGENAAAVGYSGDLSYYELMMGVTRELHPGLTGDLKVYWSPDYQGEVGHNWIVEGGLSRKLGTWGSLTPSLSARIGKSMGDEDKGGFDYYYWNVGMSVLFANYFEFDIRYYDTIDVPTAALGSSCRNLCDGRVVARITFEN